MDLSKFKTSDWMKIGGAIGFFIFGFFSWVTVDGPAGFGSADAGGNVFDFFWTGTLPWLLVIATGVITFLLVQGVMKSRHGAVAADHVGSDWSRRIAVADPPHLQPARRFRCNSRPPASASVVGSA